MAADTAALKKQTTQSYDVLAAELVAAFDGYFETSARHEADRLLAGLPPGALVLDLGCGGGSASSYLTEHGCVTVSADLSEAMLRACQRRGLEHVVRLDLEDLPFAGRTFDGIWAHTSLLHVPKERLARALEGVARALKPGGAFFVALREGTTEGYEGGPGMERWFSNYEMTEFERYVPPGLQVVERSRNEGTRVTFLNVHLRKGEW
jgi:SAM-dependent methyltransferase